MCSNVKADFAQVHIHLFLIVIQSQMIVKYCLASLKMGGADSLLHIHPLFIFLQLELVP